MGRACVNPLVILLLLLASVSAISECYQGTDDYRAATVMLSMVVLGVALRFIQESRADDAAAKLKAMISVTATVVRDGQPRELPLGQLVPGDVVRLSAGDMIPADLRIISSKDMFVIQSSLTGESLPVEKFDAKEDAGAKPVLELKNTCFLGTSVESGTATGVIVETGFRTYLGGMAKAIVGQHVQTSFDQGVTRFTWLMIRFMLVMVPLVFLINGLTKHDWMEAFFFALAVAVGLTPEMLPMIVSVCLSRGAIAMSRHKVIVKRLNSIQNLGAMDVLCTDKTGTLTLDRVILERHCDVVRHEDEGVLVLAYLNSHFQTGLKNVLDRAILQFQEIHEKAAVPDYKKVDEIPFDFSRKRMSVVVETPDGVHRLICKGATEAVFQRCDRFELEGKVYPVDPLLIADLKEYCDDLSADGFRVLAIAYKDVERRAAYSKDDEQDLILKGYVAFLDPPKDTAAPAILALRNHGVAVKVLTGDNELVSRKICAEVGLATDRVLLGGQVETMSDAELAEAAENTTLFARLSPAHKQRVIRALQSKKHVVGFLGDGINDSPGTAHGRRGHLGRQRGGHRQGGRRHHPPGKEPDGARRGRDGRPQGVRQHPQVRPHGRQLELRQHVQRAGGQRLRAVPADDAHPDPDQQSALRLLPGSDSRRRRRRRSRSPSRVPGTWARLARFILFVGPCSSIFDYTTYLMMLLCSLFNTGLLPPPELASVRRSATSAQLRGRAVPDRLVRRIAADANAHHPHHPHQPHSFLPKPGELAADGDHGDHHGGGHVAALVADRALAWVCASAPALAPVGVDAGVLRPAHPRGQDVVHTQKMDIGHKW